MISKHVASEIFHDHKLIANDVCTNLLHKCWQLKFWKIKCRKCVWSEVKCCQWIYAEKKKSRTKMLPLEECHCRYVLAFLVCRAGPEGGFTLLSTLLFYNSLWCTNWSCIGPFRKAVRLMVGTVNLWFSLLCATILKSTLRRYLST
jgi:hypothetical protein